MSFISGKVGKFSDLNDELGRKPFADGVANLIKNHTSEDCIVLGIEGSWGEGKSYTIEMIKGAIEKNNKDSSKSIKWITFNPWHFTDRDHLAKIFLSDLIKNLEKPKTLRKIDKFVLSLAKKLKPFIENKTAINMIFWSTVAVLSVCGKITASFSIASFGLAINYAIVHVLSPNFRNKKDEILTELSQVLTDYIKAIESGSSSDESKTLIQLKEEISSKLVAKNFPYSRIIIAIEDLDRLEPPEVRIMMQLMRMIADFPKITYLLGYDRKQVSKALGEIWKDSPSEARIEHGKGYLNKVVQAAYQLPPSSSSAIANLLLNQWAETVKKIYGSDFTQHPYCQSTLPLIGELWSTVRNGERTLNRSLLITELLKEKSNPVDVLVVSFLMEEQPDLCKWILSHHREFLRGGRKLMKQALWNNSNNKGNEYLEDQIKGDKSYKEGIANLLMTVFPALNYDESGADDIDSVRNYRICTSDHFWSYFQYAVSESAMVHDIAEQIFITPDQQKVELIKKTTELGDDGMYYLVRDLSTIQSERKYDWDSVVVPLIISLGKTYDNIKHNRMFVMQPTHRILWLTVKLINNLPDTIRSEKLVNLVEELLKNDVRSLAFNLFEKVGRENDMLSDKNLKKSSTQFELQLTDTQKEELTKLMQQSLSNWTSTKENVKEWLSHEYAAEMLFNWLRFDNVGARTAIDSWLKNDDGLLMVLSVMIDYQYTQSLSSRQGAVAHKRLNPYGLKKLLGMTKKELIARVENMSESFKADNQEVINLLIELDEESMQQDSF